MPHIVKFLDYKLYQSLGFDADMKFPEGSEYAKKIWVLKEYKKSEGQLDLTEGFEGLEKKGFPRTHSSYSIAKSFDGDELIVELIENIKFIDDFDYFSKADLEEKTGEEELDKILLSIKESDFDQVTIAEFILGSDNSPFKVKGVSDKVRELFSISGDFQFGDFKQHSSPIEPEEDCLPDCDCDCDNE
jgi:hypothetical protein|tara:strand:- start:1558 stop:2121 length:564 start_codon:yes stop_codon:yes gene_type:complete